MPVYNQRFYPRDTGQKVQMSVFDIFILIIEHMHQRIPAALKFEKYDFVLLEDILFP